MLARQEGTHVHTYDLPDLTHMSQKRNPCLSEGWVAGARVRSCVPRDEPAGETTRGGREDKGCCWDCACVDVFKWRRDRRMRDGCVDVCGPERRRGLLNPHPSHYLIHTYTRARGQNVIDFAGGSYLRITSELKPDVSCVCVSVCLVCV